MPKLRDRLTSLVNRRNFVPFCLASGICLRLLWVSIVDPDQVSDFKWYFLRAVSIAHGTGYSVDGIRTAYWPVGYPGFLGVAFYLFGPSVFLAKCLNIVLYAVLILLTYWVGKRVFRSELAARLTVFFLSFYPNHVAYATILSTEILFAFLIMLGAALLIARQERTGWLLWAGLVWGMAALTKPQAIFVPIIFLVALARNPRSFLKAAVTVYVTLIVTISPWLIRNHFAVGAPTLSTNGGIVLFIGNNPYATGGQIWDDHVKSLLGDLGTDNMFDGKEVEREARAESFAIRYIKHHPVRTVLLWPRKLVGLYASDVDGFYYSLGAMRAAWAHQAFVYLGFRIFGELYYLFLLTLAGIGMYSVLCRPSQGGGKIGIYLILYFTATYLLFFAIARYHFAFMPWVVLYSGIGGEQLLQRKRREVTEGLE